MAYSVGMLKPRSLPIWGMIKLVASPNQKYELGNLTFTKRCALCSRTQRPSFMRRVIFEKPVRECSRISI